MFNIILLQLRVHQWTKNVLIFIPLVFSGRFIYSESVWQALLAALLFSCLASSVYIFNDLVDVKHDRVHPKKRFRPLASGKISIKLALGILIFLLVVSLGITYALLDKLTFSLFVVYLVTNILYSRILKNLPPLDIIVVGLFYLLRPVVGATAIGVAVSSWLVITILFAAIFIVSLKRYSELYSMTTNNLSTSRKNIDHYTLAVLESIGLISITTSVVSYAIYASGFAHFFVLTVVPLFGLIARLYLIKSKYPDHFENPERAVVIDTMSASFLLIWVVWILIYHWKIV